MKKYPPIFPGIDPYVEAQGFWPDFHSSFMAYLRDYLLDHLPENYEARIDERFQILETTEPRSRRIEPDLSILRHKGPTKTRRSSRAKGTLVLEPVTIPLVIEEESRESYIRIIWRPDRSVVTLLEILSPANKTKPGWDYYLAKRNEILRNPIHLVEFDLLLLGRRMPLQKPYPPGDYHALVSRWDQRPDCEVYSWSMQDSLPSVPVPLKPGDGKVSVDFPRLYKRAFERGRYGGYINYAKRLTVRLNQQQQEFTRKIVRSKIIS